MSRVGAIRLAVMAAAIGLLELACRTGLIDHRVVIPPSEMADALVRLLIAKGVIRAEEYAPLIAAARPKPQGDCAEPGAASVTMNVKARPRDDGR